MAFKAGTASHLLVANTANAYQNLSRFADNFGWPQSVAQLEVSAFGTAAKAFIPGLTDGDTITIAGPYDATSYTHFTALKAAQSAGSGAAGLTWSPGGSVASEAKIVGSVYVSQVSVPATVGNRVEFSVSLQVTGAVSNTTW